PPAVAGRDRRREKATGSTVCSSSSKRMRPRKDDWSCLRQLVLGRLSRMKRVTRWSLWLSLCLLAPVQPALICSRLTAPQSGSMEDLYKRVRVGMSQQEAVAALQAGDHDYVDTIYVSGTDRRGRRFTTFYSFQGMPPASEVRDAELTVTCSTGEHVEV